MRALVLEGRKKLRLRDIEIDEPLGERDVRIQIRNVGICGSDVHYYLHGRIGSFVVEEPMVLGHEAAGVVAEVGSRVTRLKAGDHVTMEPGIPDPNSRASRLGMYNLDPAVRFWATPPVHGVLRPTVVHPADFTFKVPDSVSLPEAAMVEPLAVGIHAATKAHIRPGDVAVVIGSGTIGMVTGMAALAGGCSRVVIADVQQPKLDIAARFGAVTAVNVRDQKLTDAVDELTDGWGADIVFECSGNEKAAAGALEPARPGGCVVFIGMPAAPIAFDVVAAEIKEVRIETVFRYAHVYPRALSLMGSGKINVKPLITDTFDFEDSVKAFNFAAERPAASVKVQISLPE